MARLHAALLFVAVVASAGETPRLVPQVGHAGDVLAVAWSQDGAFFVTGSEDGTAKIWDARSLKLSRTLAAHPGGVWDVALSPDGRTVYTCGADEKLRAWDVPSGEERRVLDAPLVAVVDCSRDGRRLATGHGHGWVAIYDAATGAIERTIHAHEDGLWTFALSPDGGRLLTGAQDGTIRLWDTATKEMVRELERSDREIAAVAFSLDGTRIATGGFDRKARLWDAATGALLATFDARNFVLGLAFFPDGQRLATASLGSAIGGANTIKLWDLADQTLLREFQRIGGRASSVAISPDGRRLLSGNAGNAGMFIPPLMRSVVWDAEAGREIARLEGQARIVRRFGVDPAAPRIVLALDDKTIRLWDAATGQGTLFLRAPQAEFTSVAFGPGGATLATGDSSGLIQVWEGAGGTEQARLERHDGSVSALVFSPDGTRLVSAGWDKTVRLWDLASRREVRRLLEYTGETGFSYSACLAWSRDGTRLLVGKWDDTLLLVDAATGATIRALEGHTAAVAEAAFSPDGTLAASASNDGTARVWDLAQGTLRHTLQGSPTALGSLAFSPDGRTLVTGGWRGEVLVWSSDSGELVQRLTPHLDSVVGVGASPNGRLLFTASSDRTVAIHDATSGTLIATLVCSPQEMMAALPDGRYMAPRGALAAVAFGLSGRAHPFEPFDLYFHRPDLVLERIGEAAPELLDAYRAAHRARLRRMGVREAAPPDPSAMPEVRILGAPPPTTAEATLAIEATASDPTRPLASLVVEVNGVPGAVDLRREPARSWKGTIPVELSSGSNRIRIVARNDKGVESFPDAIEVVREGEARLPDLYLVAVGVSRTRDERFRLAYAAKDATDLAAHFRGRTASFRAVHETLLLDGNATREAILACRETLARAGVDDQVVVFFAGHGLLVDRADYWFATVDLDFARPALRGLKYEEMEGLFDVSKARRKLLLLDTCHSGEVDPGETPPPPSRSCPEGEVRARAFRGLDLPAQAPLGLAATRDLLGELFADLRRGSGTVVIAAAGGAEFALESSRFSNGVFTYAVLSGLRGARADSDRDGKVAVSELRDHVLAEVRLLTGGRQSPTSRRENLEFDWPVD